MKKRISQYLLLGGCIAVCSAVTVEASVREPVAEAETTVETITETITEAEIKGILISEETGEVKWDWLSQSEYSFVIVNVGENMKMDPAEHDYFIQIRSSSNISVGAYYTTDADTIESGLQNVQYLLRHIQGYYIKEPLIIQWQPKTEPENRDEIQKAMEAEIKSAGYYPVIWDEKQQGAITMTPKTVAITGCENPVQVLEDQVGFYALLNWQTAYSTDYQASEGYWSVKNGKNYYELIDGSNPPVQQWKQIDDQWYYFLNGGEAATGWIQMLNSAWYYADANGVRQSGWQEIDGATYYFEEATGVLHTKWLCLNGDFYYFDPVSGKLQKNNTLEIQGIMRSFGKDGKLLIN